MPVSDDVQLAPPAGVPAPEAIARNLDQAAASFARFITPNEPARAPDGKFTSTRSLAETPAAETPAAETPTAETSAEEEEQFEIEADGEKYAVTASELARLVAESKKPGKSEAPPSQPDDAVVRARVEASLSAERQRLEQERTYYAQQLANFVPQAVRDLQAQFPEIKTPQDVYRLAAEDPARYVQFQAAREAIGAAQAEHQRMLTQAQQHQQQEMARYINEQIEKLQKAEPLFADEAKGPVERQAIRSFLNKQGFTDEELAGLTDHRTVIVARKAMLYDRMMAAKPEAKKIVPMIRSIRPGSTRAPAAPAAAQAAQTAREQLKQTGSVDALAAMLRAQGVR
jgi:hypothetical protein